MSFGRSSSRVLAVLLGAVLVAFPYVTLAQDSTGSVQSQIDAHNAQIAALNANIAKYQAQLNALGKQKSTLQSAISSLTIQQQKLSANLQITQNQIASANLQITQLGSAIGDKETKIASDNAAIASALKEVNEGDSNTFIEQLFNAQKIDDAWVVVDQAGQFNKALVGHIDDLSDAKVVLSNNRATVAGKQKELTTLKTSLVTEQKSLTASKAQQQSLLAQTKNSESSYQKLLAAAQAELTSFSAFTSNATGGKNSLTNQTVCDSWGCYYNQRDTQWGGMPMNGTQYSILTAGCLITSMAMVLTHYGYSSVNPISINSNPANFAAYEPAFLLNTITVAGVSATRVTASIDSTLAKGDPIIVGLHAYGGTHFVVLTGGSKGNYTMRDPWIANGKDISFAANYTVRSIYEINKVVIN